MTVVNERVRIGVLALQGAFREHVRVLRGLGADVVEVRLPEELAGLDGLVIPGGESTTMTRLAGIYGLDEAIRRFEGAVFGTCAGMILVDRERLGLIDLVVRRNAFGRQVASFEADLGLAGEDRPFRAVFIRAPWVEETGGRVEVLGTDPATGRIVAVRQGPLLATSFHPELTGDARIHRLFVDMVRERT